MNTPAIDTPEETSEPMALSPARPDLAKAMITLIRRELWEHRLFWIVPLVVAVMMLVCALPAHLNPQLESTVAPNWFDARHKAALFSLAQLGLAAPHYLILAFILNFYLLDCLFAERKDRSILFWKSLPLSDGLVVASKLLTALVVAPLGVFLLAAVTNLLFTAIWNLREWLQAGFILWDTVAFLQAQLLLFWALVLCVLWYAPIVGYMALVSAWARRNVFLWVTLPPVLLIIAERLSLGTWSFGRLLLYRLSPGFISAAGLDRAMRRSMLDAGGDQMLSVGELLHQASLGRALLDLDLWLGLAVFVGFAFAAARIRRYREDA